MIPADGLVLEAHDLFVKQALLAGEPYPVEKRPGPLMDWMLPKWRRGPSQAIADDIRRTGSRC